MIAFVTPAVMTCPYANYHQSLELWPFTLYFWIKSSRCGVKISKGCSERPELPGWIPNTFLGLASMIRWNKWTSGAEQMYSNRSCLYRRGNVPGECKQIWQGGVLENWASCWISSVTLWSFRTDRWNVQSYLAWQDGIPGRHSWNSQKLEAVIKWDINITGTWHESF